MRELKIYHKKSDAKHIIGTVSLTVSERISKG